MNITKNDVFKLSFICIGIVFLLLFYLSTKTISNNLRNGKYQSLEDGLVLNTQDGTIYRIHSFGYDDKEDKNLILKKVSEPIP